MDFVTGHGISFERNKQVPEAYEKAAAKWREIEEELRIDENEDSITLFCGAKNNGKSSLVRHIANSYLKKKDSYVCYIDFDPGQPEMTTPGLVSAHIIRSNELPLTSLTYLNLNQHQQLLVSCVGGLNMSVNPRVYIENCRHVLKAVMKERESHHCRNPVLINTMGFIRGVGLAILLDLIKICKPTNLVVLNIPEDSMRIIHADLTPNGVQMTKPSFYREDSSDLLMKLSYRHLVHDLSFTFPDSTSVATKNRTALQLAYFAYIPEALYKPIMRLTPKWVSLKSTSIHCVSSYPLKPLTVLEILNHSWVHLVKLRQSPVRKEIMRSETVDDNEPEIICNMVDDIGANLLMGCGIVSGLDLANKRIAIITPTSQELLDKKIDCIIKPLSLQVPREIIMSLDQ